MTRDEVIAEARSWKGTKWVHQASCKGAGADCLGFGAGVAAACGSAEAARFLATPDLRNYGRHPDPAMLFAGCDDMMDRIPLADALPGDVLVFNCGKHPMHFGFLAPNNRLIHNWLVARRGVVEHQLDDGWRARIVRVYRLRGIE